MSPATTSQRFSSFDNMSAADVQALLAGAQSLEGTVGSALKNRHVAVLCEQPMSAAVNALAAAAVSLGAAVVRLVPSTLALRDLTAIRQTARLLGQLYGVICTAGLEPSINTSLARWAGVPVLSDLTVASHPVQILADLLVMQQHARQPIASLTLGLRADTDAASLRAWQQVSALTGLKISRFDEPPPADPVQICDFHVGSGPQPGGSVWQPLVASGQAAGRCDCLVEQQLDARQRLLKSLMAQVAS